VAHGEYKTSGGKLVIVDFDVLDERLANVAVSGDFFLEPPEALESINQTLNGLNTSLDEDTLAAEIRSGLPDGVALIGFSPEAIAIAIRRGIE
jgi:lipoate---protein ligase